MPEQDNLQVKKQELKLKILEEQECLLKDFHQEHLRLSMENIRQKRELIHLFILVSSGIIGALLVFEKSNLIKNTSYVIVGSIFFLLVIIYGFYYLTRILTKEGNTVDEFAKVFFGGLKLVEESYKKYFENTTVENWDSVENSREKALKQMNFRGERVEKDDKKFSPGLYIIFGLFFVGLVFLVLSIVEIPKLLLNFFEIIKWFIP